MSKKNSPQGFEQVFFADGHQLASSNPVKKDLANLKSALRQLNHNTDLLIDAFTQRCNNEKVSVDCRMGCEWCCHQAVFATTHEMIVVAGYIEKHFSKEAIDQVRERAKAKEEKLAALTPAETLKSNQPCPLLRKGSCMVYPVRPMACRIYLSSSEKSCHAKYLRPADPGVVPSLFDFTLKAGRQLNEGFASALKEEGHAIEEHRIEHILLELLKSPGKKNEWLHGATIHKGFPFDEVL